LLFEKWIFCNGQPVRDDDRRIFVTTTFTYQQRSLVLVAFASAHEIYVIVNKISVQGAHHRITYAL